LATTDAATTTVLSSGLFRRRRNGISLSPRMMTSTEMKKKRKCPLRLLPVVTPKKTKNDFEFQSAHKTYTVQSKFH